ncbi:DNA (cytosine-5-)-methyltransferase [Actinotignum urinale]|uniref:DNA cytosine methyltransferase n=1 Tax=Actinotignum urinale TaxID=190146 RepID=UPI002A80FACE|nr:DNA (cytosine-5-)-methyltransferase [Actinotignum urinale]MDY5129855.1 DNA (cytosine-5-)-methyltransferase [Actinotignum urinale]
MTQTLRLGSLFDGSGGFPLAATKVGIEPVWASEIEPFPILVTTTRFPQMQHLGDICNIDGSQLEPVDVVTFGSPCQDLSVAGKRAGLAGERSGLFHQAVRVIKEMRKASSGRYPRFAVWENVPGAFSSNKGADFHSVLQNLISVVDEQAAANLPRVQKWQKAGAIVADQWSIAWRVLDAQFFGVPQRRKRIYLICDFASGRAGQILFEPSRSSRNLAQGCSEKQNPPTNPRAGTHEASKSLEVFALRMRAGKPGGGKGPLVQTNLSGTLGCGNDQTIFEPAAFGFNALHEGRGAAVGRYGYSTEVSKTLDTSGVPPTCNQGGIAIVDTDVISASKADFFCRGNVNVAGALLASDSTEPPLVTDPCVPDYRVRRLTPTECARLQGFPDDWTRDLAIGDPTDSQLDYWWQVWARWAKAQGLKKPKTRNQVRSWLANPVTDRALYKLWGNGIALPCAKLVLSQIVAETTKTPRF